MVSGPPDVRSAPKRKHATRRSGMRDSEARIVAPRPCVPEGINPTSSRPSLPWARDGGRSVSCGPLKFRRRRSIQIRLPFSSSRYCTTSITSCLAPWAFKRAPVVSGCVRLDADKPHIGIAEFAARMRNHPPSRKYLKRSHGSPSQRDFYSVLFLSISIRPGI